jgi:hypothetical protein
MTPDKLSLHRPVDRAKVHPLLARVAGILPTGLQHKAERCWDNAYDVRQLLRGDADLYAQASDPSNPFAKNDE